MKKTIKGAVLLLAAMTFVFGACNAQKSAEKVPTNGKPIIAAAATTFNYGQVEEGTKVEHVFKILNKGDGILEIKKATGS